MSIIFQFGPSLLQSSTIPPATTTCSAQSVLRMGPGLENDSNLSLLSADDSSIIDVSTSQLYSEKGEVQRQTCFGLPYQDHNYGAPPPPTPPTRSPHLSPAHISPVVETETVSITTTYEPQDVSESSITRCVCGFDHDDEYMICCDQCQVWQHVDCMGLDRNKIPETYLCEQCEPRRVDRQRAKLLQSKKKVHLREKTAANATSEDSEGETSNQNSESHPKNRNSRSSRRKNASIDKEIKNEQPAVPKKTKAQSKQLKERMEMKRSKLRRRVRSKSETTCSSSTPDEEAQDAWKCSFDWEKNISVGNWYSENIKAIMASGLKNADGDEVKLSKQLQAQLCKVVEASDNVKKVVADQELSRDQLIIEWKGRFFSSTEFHQTNPLFKQRLFPFVLLYKLKCASEELYIDSTEYANDARFIRRSCMPNAEVKHVVLNDALHLYISSTKNISEGEEITIPFDMEVLGHDVVSCACASDSCQLIHHHDHKNSSIPETSERRKRSRRHSSVIHSTDEDSNHSLSCIVSSPSKSSKGSPIKTSSLSPKVLQSDSEHAESRISQEEQDYEEQRKQNKRKKMTREERKLDAIMRAFDQMEKAAKRRQQALDRLATQKQHTQKSEESLSSSSSTEKQEISSPVAVTSSVMPPVCTVNPTTCDVAEDTSPLKEEEKISTPDETAAEEEKPSPLLPSTVKSNKKGKRRRGSGTQTRRRTRSNSGNGLDIPINDEASSSLCENGFQCLSSASSVEASDAASIESCAPSPCTTPQATTPVTPTVLPKTKRFLHHEWLQEKAETTLPTSPVPMQSDSNCNFVQPIEISYVSCVKDNPNGGISAAHMRRSSVGGGVQCKQTSGSAKKRWLRQAMNDCEPLESEPVMEEVSSPVYSPSDQSEIVSPCVTTPDNVFTPLKKRRIMRDTLQSAEWTFSGASPDHSSSEAFSYSINDTVAKDLRSELDSKEEEESNTDEKGPSGGNGLGKHLLKSLKEGWLICRESHCEKNTKEVEESSADEIPLNSTDDEIPLNSTDDEIPLNSTVEVKECGDCAVKTESSNVNSEDSSSLISDAAMEVDVAEQDVKPFLPDEKTSPEGQIEQPSVLEDFCDNIKPVLVKVSESSVIEDVNNENIIQPVQNSSDLTSIEQCDVQEMSELVNSESSVCCMEDLNCTVDKNLNKTIESTDSECERNLSNKEDKVPSNAQIIATVHTEDETVNSGHINEPSAHLATDEALISDVIAVSEENHIDTDKATPKKRKVTLSEYRQRKRDNQCSLPSDKKKNNNCSLEVLPKEEIKLAALPLFDKSLKCTNSEVEKSKEKEIETRPSTPLPEKREKLVDRLKREFGVEDISDSHEDHKPNIKDAEHQSVVAASLLKPGPSDIPHHMLSYCAPPPPPPPMNSSPVGSAQFGYTGGVPSQTYAQQSSFIVSQVPSGQYIEGQNHLAKSVAMIPAMHHSLGVAAVTPPPPPPPPQQGCSYSASMQPSSSSCYFYPNGQAYASTAQPTQNSVYNSPFKSRAYK